MPDDTPKTEPVPSNRDLATMPLTDAILSYAPTFQAVLPPGITVDHFARMIVTAVNVNPELRYCDRRTLFNAAVRCASDGLLPDGREAALVPFRTKIKKDGQDVWIDAVQYLPMVAGIRKRLYNSGEVKTAVAEVVHTNDRFRWQLGDTPMIEHFPAELDEDPGEVRGAYAIITLKNGGVIREVLRRRDIERARAASKAPTGPGWKDWYDEMSRKTALKRCSKSAPTSSILQRLLDGEDEVFTQEHVALPPARPQPGDFMLDAPDTAATTEPADGQRKRGRKPAVIEDVKEPVKETAADGQEGDKEPADAAKEPVKEAVREPQAKPYFIADAIGDIVEFDEWQQATAALGDMLEKAPDEKALVAIWENGENLLSKLREEGHDTAVEALGRQYDDMREGFVETQTAPPDPPGGAIAVVYDPNRDVRLWYQEAKARLTKEMAGHPPADFDAFVAAHAEPLEKLRSNYRNLAKFLDELLALGKQGKL